MTLSHYFNALSLILAAALITVLGLATDASAQESRLFLIDLNSRTITQLDTLGSYGPITSLNDAGQVAGWAYTAEGATHAFITAPDMGARDLGTLGGRESYANDINNRGQVVGWSETAEGLPYAFITGPDGMRMRSLDTLPGDHNTAWGMNNAGQVVGVSGKIEDPSSHAFITGPDGTGMRKLGTLGGVSSAAWDINDAGQVVGWSDTAAGYYHAFITGANGMGMRDLGTLGGGYSQAYDINDAGQVVGYATTGDPAAVYPGEHAFITGPDGMGMRDLGTFGGISSYAEGINNSGQVVGYYTTLSNGNYVAHRFLTGSNGEGIVDLNSLVDLPPGVILTDPIDINNNGQVLAVGIIPEPETYALMLPGLGLIGFMARRKKSEVRI